ncbi:MAG TPA: LysM peptidoglycan-binding domain-containing protein [Planctomycetota bacterium]|mgnify:CR=1 FL=1|jgi:LysM repeat protein|nr:LysM peptidoglycan-binding domain-containing protein [Planctomycetota bacterium]OQC20993.1 MAG: LysM domain/BON superfamily protein [Planctomycetes bacterium ADurb.Bin069]HNR98487.1 LysM peptidoglycan-binding domain-containing protein [Planctomycetota bacterium]HNU25093.1 LysM peptidoglycan-binding domain-containing protein [Planctomycetota bacterium]HOE30081.1 LysM peptidoglycan-binding domain-containing protein [Planctomycetota bacterium]
MNHMLRLAVLTGLVFAAMSLYLAIPPDGDFWERASAKEPAAESAHPLMTIFIGNRAPARSAGVPARPAPGAEERQPEVPEAYTNMWASNGAEGSAEPAEAVFDLEAPDAPAAPEPRPEAVARGRSYTIEQGDTLSKIAARELGTVKQVEAILKLNPGIKPERLVPGREIILPVQASDDNRPDAAPSSDGARRAPDPPAEPARVPAAERDPAPGRAAYKLVTIKKGDSLYAIAREHCGDVGKVSAIVNLNRDWMPRGERQRLPVGRKIKVPVP